MDNRLVTAFLESRDGYSADRVIADIKLNQRFLVACREQGLSGDDEDLNRQLLNARKASGLQGLETGTRTCIQNQDEYVFASEIAIRFLERRDSVTLDQVICDPVRAAEFDAIAARIAPGYSSLEYRWAALRLRKKGSLKPEILAHVCKPESVIHASARELDLAVIPVRSGLYLFFDSQETLYVGETSNLRNRLSKHLEHSDNKGLARWIWSHGPDGLNVEIQVLPDGTTTKVRRAMERELIKSRRPVFNVSGV